MNENLGGSDQRLLWAGLFGLLGLGVYYID